MTQEGKAEVLGVMQSTAYSLAQHISAKSAWYWGENCEWKRETVKLYTTVGRDQQYTISAMQNVQ